MNKYEKILLQFKYDEEYKDLIDESTIQYLKEVSEMPTINTYKALKLLKIYNVNYDENILKELIESNLKLVIPVAKKYINCGIPLLDLIQVGNIGLIEGLKNFNEKRNNNLFSFLNHTIFYEIDKYVVQNTRTIRYPLSMSMEMRELSNYKERVKMLEGRSLTEKEAAQFLNISIEELRIRTLTEEMVSLDLQVDDDVLVNSITYDTSYGDIATKVTDRLLCLKCLKILKEVNPRDYYILILKYGLNGDSPLNNSKIGDLLDLSRERVRQIDNTNLEILREKIKIYK